MHSQRARGNLERVEVWSLIRGAASQAHRKYCKKIDVLIPNQGHPESFRQNPSSSLRQEDSSCGFYWLLHCCACWEHSSSLSWRRSQVNMEICSNRFLFSIITCTGLSGKDVYISNTLSSCQQLPGSGVFSGSTARQGLAES